MSLFVSSDISVLSVHEDAPARSRARNPIPLPTFSSGAGGHTKSALEPRTRLVSRQEYLGTLLGKGSLYSITVAVGCLGVVILAYMIHTLVHDTVASHGQWVTLIFLFSESILMGAVGIAAIWYARVTFASVREMETVAPITRHNTGHLSEFETLVRAYAFDPSQHHAELLRAALDGHQTSAQELLRSTMQDLRNG